MGGMQGLSGRDCAIYHDEANCNPMPSSDCVWCEAKNECESVFDWDPPACAKATEAVTAVAGSSGRDCTIYHDEANCNPMPSSDCVWCEAKNKCESVFDWAPPACAKATEAVTAGASRDVLV